MEAERGGHKSEKQQIKEAEQPKEKNTTTDEFAAPFWTQYLAVQIRVFQQYWRTPSYI